MSKEKLQQNFNKYAEKTTDDTSWFLNTRLQYQIVM